MDIMHWLILKGQREKKLMDYWDLGEDDIF